jgi:hypothetical protein
MVRFSERRNLGPRIVKQLHFALSVMGRAQIHETANETALKASAKVEA